MAKPGTAEPTGPVRMCVICRERKQKACLTRHVIIEAAGDGATGRGCVLAADARAVMPGRGFYLCREAACQAKFLKFSGWRKHCHGGSAR